MQKTAIVTGSTSGIGLGIAESFAGSGHHVILNGFGDAGEIEALRAGMATQYGVKVRYDGADMSKPEAIEAMMQRVLPNSAVWISSSTMPASSTWHRSMNSRSTNGTRSSPSISAPHSTPFAWPCRG